MKIEELYRLFLSGDGISTDTRKIESNTIFFALKGENFNGNKFAEKALESGAAYAVIDEPTDGKNEKLLLVDDVLKTLQNLATFHRRQLGIPILALTGSNGKTTTKELINNVLSRKFKTVATKGNLNNHIGVPLTLLSMNNDTEFGIVEMGANHLKEIEILCRIAEPDYGLITNFGKAHLEGFGSLQGVIQGKSELYDHLKTYEKTLFLNFDDPEQKKHAGYPHHYSFGSGEDVEVKIEKITGKPFATIRSKGLEVQSLLTGGYNANNIAAAFCIGIFFDIPAPDVKAAIEHYNPQNNRSQILERGSTKIILDAYNANPTSMAAAIENLDSQEHDSKAAILGDMFEMGAAAAEEHQQLVEKLQNSGIEKIYLIGENFYNTHTDPGKIRKFRTFNDFKESFNPTDLEKSLVLIKGSRGMALERVLELF